MPESTTTTTNPKPHPRGSAGSSLISPAEPARSSQPRLVPAPPAPDPDAVTDAGPLASSHTGDEQRQQQQRPGPDSVGVRAVADARLPPRLWLACAAGVLERFVWYGVTAPLQNYLQNPPSRTATVPGALGLGQAAASNIVNALMIGSYVTPVPAAVVADCWLGSIEAVGATILFATSLPAVASHQGVALGGVVAACVLLAVGSGGVKTTVVPFIADQYDQTEPRVWTAKNGERVVGSRELTITYIYNVFYWAINIVGFFADSMPLLERYVGFWVAYLIPCICMWLALVPILVGRNSFVRTSPTRNIMPEVLGVLWCGISGGFKMDAAKPDAQLARGRRVTWDSSFVDDIKRSLLTCRVLLSFPIHWLCYNQTFNNLISQAGQMVTYGIPNDMMKIAGAISGILVAPIIQKGLYPYLTNRNITFSPVARMTVGFIVLTASMAYTTGIQKLIYKSGPCYDHPLDCASANEHTIPNQVSVFLQVPIYFGGALAEVFCLTTGTEYAYNHAPKRMKTLVQAIWLTMAGIGSLLALAFTPLTRNPHLVTLYAIMTGLLGAATVLFWVLFRNVDRDRPLDEAREEPKEENA
ncbi:POT family-domain-containing protein [Xylariomycetidae sp. FL0641]|nr:POT family-domain-containing protein [Xylariomycetidae sp. FL0641]